MHRGYFKCWRKMIESDLWDKSPLHLKVWTWILASVDYKTGELTCTMDHIADRVQWSDKGHPHIPSRKVIHDILHWMKLNSMLSITTLGEGNRKYTKLSVISWQLYQQEKEPDSNRTETEKLQSLSIIKHLEEVPLPPPSRLEGNSEAYQYVQDWNTTFSKTLNRRISQIEDQAAIQQLLAEGKTLDHLCAVRTWIKAHGKIQYWPRPQNLLGYTKGGAGPRVIEQIEMEMETQLNGKLTPAKPTIEEVRAEMRKRGMKTSEDLKP